MTDLAIRVEGLSKCYRLGQRECYRTLRDAIARRFSAPFHRIHSTLQRAHAKQTFGALKDVSFEVKQRSGASVMRSQDTLRWRRGIKMQGRPT